VNAGFNEAAANTTTCPGPWAVEEAWGDDEDLFGPHPTRPATSPATSKVGTKPAKIPSLRMNEP
jgi:hypothetical protein